MENSIVPAGAVARREVDGSEELAVSSDVQSMALAAQAEAEVKARWAIAQRCPRDIDMVRIKLLKECDRPKFAEAARYAKPVGKDKVVGPSIRFVEAALRCYGNILAATTVISEDATTRRLQVVVTDLEANISWPRQISFVKSVMRSSSEGRQVISKRLNSYGKTTYEVVATEDEFASKEAALVSKAIRMAGLRVLPGDLVEEAMERCVSTNQRTDKADPSAARKKMVDGFAMLGVMPGQLVEYLGHPLENCSPAELQELRDAWHAIRDGETKWADFIESKKSPEAAADFGTTKPVAPQASPPKTAAKPEPKQTPPPPLAVVRDAPEPGSDVEPVADDAEAKIAAESLAIQESIAKAKSKGELNQLVTRIQRLPDAERKLAMELFAKRTAVLK